MRTKNIHYRNSILLKLANTNNYISIPELVDFTTSEYWRGDKGLDFETIDNILKEEDISRLLDPQSINKRTKTGGIRETKTYKLIDDFNTFLEIICYIDDIYFDSLMRTNYYKKFELEFKNRIKEETELDPCFHLNVRELISINFYDSDKDIYDNIKDSCEIRLKTIAIWIRKNEKLKRQLKLLKSQPLDKITNQRIKIIENLLVPSKT